MADSIVRCDKILKEDSTIHRYDFSYRVENNDAVNTFCVVILASEMENPESDSEARTKANLKASEIKANWIAQETLTSTDLSYITGNVTL